MRRQSLAVAAIALSAVAASAPAKADPFHLIRWSDTGFCQIWDQSIPTVPWPSDYAVVSEELPSFDAAFAYKTGLLGNGTCAY